MYINGYINFPNSLFNDDGTIHIGTIPGIYNEMLNRLNSSKPFFVKLNLGNGNWFVGCPVVGVTPLGINFGMVDQWFIINKQDSVAPIE